MDTFRCLVAYDGTAFRGWQVQPGHRTVQGVLAEELSRVLRQPVSLCGASRTDAGVHALGQVVSFTAETRLSLESLQRAWNAGLPPDVVVYYLGRAPAGFDACRQALRKRYGYLVCDSGIPNPFLRHYHWQWPRGRLDVEAMSLAARYLLGQHDFASFQNMGSVRTSSVRTLFDLRVSRVGEITSGSASIEGEGRGAGSFDPAHLFKCCAVPWLSSSRLMFLQVLRTWQDGTIVIEVEGDGFLYHMVRTIVGTLVEVGRGAKPPEWVAEVLSARDRRTAGPTAPPQGLYLLRVDYPADSLGETDFYSGGAAGPEVKELPES